MTIMRNVRLAALFVAALCLPAVASAASVDEEVTELQHDWEVIKYQTPDKMQEKRYEALAAKARKVCEANAGRAEPLVWEGIILSSWGGAKGGLGALSLVKQARTRYEEAIRIQPDVLDGSAYNSLGVLYYKVPGWPIGFGDHKKAVELLQKALSINPNGIDPNFFYGEYLLEEGKAKEARAYLERALNAPPRPGRDIADAGRREEARKLLDEARRKAG